MQRKKDIMHLIWYGIGYGMEDCRNTLKFCKFKNLFFIDTAGSL